MMEKASSVPFLVISRGIFLLAIANRRETDPCAGRYDDVSACFLSATALKSVIIWLHRLAAQQIHRILQIDIRDGFILGENTKNML